MNIELKEKFLELWKKYFAEAELPITFYYSETEGGAEPFVKTKDGYCIIAELAKIRKGKSLYFNKANLGCPGSVRYLGYSDRLRPGFEYFLSCGNEKMEGERYKRTPEIVLEMLKDQHQLPVERKNIIFKRWDNLSEADHPEVVIFFATPDVLSGLFTLANFDSADNNRVFAPFGAGCGSIVHYPYLERQSKDFRAIIGMFDPSARPYVQRDILTFAVPFEKFEQMVNQMEESFLITKTWDTIRKRISAEK